MHAKQLLDERYLNHIPLTINYHQCIKDPIPSLGLGTAWVRQPRSGSNVIIPPLPPNVTCSRDQATANPVGGKACSSTKGGLLRYIPNTYSIHKVSSLKFAYFQGRLSRHNQNPLRGFCLPVFPILIFLKLGTNG